MKPSYRESHKTERKSRMYEELVYKQGSYDDMVWQYEKKLLDMELARLKERVPSVLRYLDFGCGTGRILGYLEEEVGEATGVDNAASMLAYARNQVKKAKLIEADLTEHDVLAGEEYDFITAFRIFLNAEPVLRKEMMRVLTPKMRDENSIFIFNMHGNIWSHRLFTKLWLTLRGRRLNTISYWQARRFAEAHGLFVERWYGFGVLPKVFYRWFGSTRMYRLDNMFARVPFMRYMAYDLVFVCKKIRNLK